MYDIRVILEESSSGMDGLIPQVDITDTEVLNAVIAGLRANHDREGLIGPMKLRMNILARLNASICLE